MSTAKESKLSASPKKSTTKASAAAAATTGEAAAASAVPSSSKKSKASGMKLNLSSASIKAALGDEPGEE
jgi:hypothetical protein